jgi:tetratricopeptide (TPR) repeat protein
MNRSHAVRCALGLAVAIAGTGCSGSRGKDVRDGMQIMQRERVPEKLVERGKAFAAIGDLTRAEQYLSAALDQGADAKEVLPILLQVCIEAERYRVAVVYARDYLARWPEELRLRFVLATLEAAIGEVDAALADLHMVVEKNPDDPDAQFTLAILLRDELHDPAGADEHFRECLRLSPGGPHAGQARASLLKVVP